MQEFVLKWWWNRREPLEEVTDRRMDASSSPYLMLVEGGENENGGMALDVGVREGVKFIED